MVHVFSTMGTMASIIAPRATVSALRQVEVVCAEVDDLFSLYSATSELSRLARGEITLSESNSLVRDAYARAMMWSADTHGLFSPHRPDGVLDLNGLVKAEAIERSGLVLARSGCTDFVVALGGDVLQSGSGEQGPWITGVIDPADRSSALCAVMLGGTRRAVATSGSAERDDHIWRGGALTPSHYLQVTVVADDIVTADVLATAIIAGGPETLDDVTDRWDVDILTVDRAGELLATPGFRHALVHDRLGGRQAWP